MTAQNKMMTAGIVLIIGGVLALLAPLAVSLAITVIVGITFLLGGLINAWAAVQDAADRLAHAIFAVLGIFLGVSFLANPLSGLVSLTVLVGLVFLLSGLVRLWLAWQRRDHSGFWLLLISGALSVLLGGLIFADVMGATGTLLLIWALILSSLIHCVMCLTAAKVMRAVFTSAPVSTTTAARFSLCARAPGAPTTTAPPTTARTASTAPPAARPSSSIRLV